MLSIVINNLRSVLCDPDGNVCIHGSPEDRQIVWDALAEIDRAEAKLAAMRPSEEAVKMARIVVTQDGGYVDLPTMALEILRLNGEGKR